MASSSDSRPPSALQRYTVAAGGVVTLAGCLIFAGWLFNSPILKGTFLGVGTMLPNTAIGFIVSGVALGLVTRKNSGFATGGLAYLCSVAVMLIGLLTLIEYIIGLNLGIDRLLFKDQIGAGTATYPGRMALSTAFNFAIIGISLVLLLRGTRRDIQIAQYLAILSGFIGLLSVIGFIYGATAFLTIGVGGAISPPTAFSFIILSIGILLMAEGQGVMTYLTNQSVGTRLVRRLLPAAVITPIVLGWLRLEGQRLGYYDTEFGLALFVTSQIIIFAGLIWWHARSLQSMDAERARTEETLRASESRFASILKIAEDAVISINQDQRIVLFNQGAEKIFGYSAEEALGQPVNMLLPARLSSAHNKFVGEFAVAGDAIRKMAGNREILGRRKNGSEFPAEASISRLEVKDGIILTVMLRDITERKQAEAELQRTLAELSRSNAELQQFAYVASHDLQEPLRMVSNYTQLLSRRYQGKLDSDADDFIAFAVDGARRMQRLINDLLTYSRVSTLGKEFEETDCEDVLEQALANLSAAIEESGAVVTHDPLPTLMADDIQLVQLFQNLIGNAIKFHGTKQPRVHISAERKRSEWLFSVHDNGIGIAPEYRERIFVIFQRLHSRDEYAGTGIGLAICKRVAERHGGRIWAESGPGEGTTFYFTIPLMASSTRLKQQVSPEELPAQVG